MSTSPELSFDQLRALSDDRLTPKNASDRIQSSEHREINTAIINKIEQSAQQSGLWVIGKVSRIFASNVPNLSVRTEALEGLTSGQSVGFVGQQAAAENGVYIYTGSGYRRATKADGFDAIVSGGVLLSESDGNYILRTKGTIKIGTTAQTWEVLAVGEISYSTHTTWLDATHSGQSSFIVPFDEADNGEVQNIDIVDTNKGTPLRKRKLGTSATTGFTYNPSTRVITILSGSVSKIASGAQLKVELSKLVVTNSATAGGEGTGWIQKGVYDPATTYEKWEWVTHQGGSYLSTVENNTAALTDSAKWKVIAAKGEKGDLSPQGLDLGPYNAATNTPFLNGNASGVVEGGFYTVTKLGNLTFAGTNFTVGTEVNIGAKLYKLGNQFYLQPALALPHDLTPRFTSEFGDLSFDYAGRKVRIPDGWWQIGLHIYSNELILGAGNATQVVVDMPGATVGSGPVILYLNLRTRLYYCERYSNTLNAPSDSLVICSWYEAKGYGFNNTYLGLRPAEIQTIIATANDLVFDWQNRKVTVPQDVLWSIGRNWSRNNFRGNGSAAYSIDMPSPYGGLNALWIDPSIEKGLFAVNYPNYGNHPPNAMLIATWMDNNPASLRYAGDKIGSYQFNAELALKATKAEVTAMGADKASKAEVSTGLAAVQDTAIRDRVVPRQPFLDLGALAYSEFDTDYVLILGYGQSLMVGFESYRAFTTVAAPGTYMIGTSPWVARQNTITNLTLTPLVSVREGSTDRAETPLVMATHAFKRQFDRYHRRGKQTQFILLVCGEGGRSIEQLSKTSTNEGAMQDNLFNQEIVRGIKKVKDAVAAIGKTVSCPIIVWGQGEYNYSPHHQNKGLTPGTNGTQSIVGYKNALKQLHADINLELRTQLGQTLDPILFTYQTCNQYISEEEPWITLAQQQYAAETPNCVLLPPHYSVADWFNGHLSANGYRWFGEYIARVFMEVFIRGYKYQPMRILSGKVVSGNRIVLDINVPVGPLVLDTWTTRPVNVAGNGYGFRIRQGGTTLAITAIELVDNKVILTVPTLNTGNFNVAYGTIGGGNGNLRDSDPYLASSNYLLDSTAGAPVPDFIPKVSAGGVNLLDVPYPLQNWLSISFLTLTKA